MATDQHLFRQLNKLHGSRTLIVGIGNTLKGDDGLGPLLCRELTGKVCAELIDAATVPENYIQPIVKKAPRNLLIIDAIDFNAPPGTINVFKPEQLNSLVISTHTLSPRIFIDMVTQAINVGVYFIGVQPAQTTFGQSLSDSVRHALQRLVDLLVELFPLPHGAKSDISCNRK